MLRFVSLIAGVVVLALGGWFLAQRGGTVSVPDLAPISAAEAQEIDTSRVLEMVLGDESAPVTVIEYASFTCPHCANFHTNVFPQLKADYIETGKVKFIYREVYFDRFGLWAGMVARCAGPMRYFGVTEMLFDQQADWARAGGGEPGQIAAALKKIGLAAGLEAETLDACMQDAEMAQAMVAVYQQNAEADNVTATPSFIIDGEPYSNMSYADFRKVLDEKLGG
jgi:protein-disulfide isomerase